MAPDDKKKPPGPGMKWSRKHGMWVDPDNRTPKRRRQDEAILRDLESDQERIDEILRSALEGEKSAIAKAAGELSERLMRALIEARKSAGLSQAEVARRMGVPQPAVVRFEAGTHSPTLMTLSRYASAIGVELRVRRPA